MINQSQSRYFSYVVIALIFTLTLYPCTPIFANFTENISSKESEDIEQSLRKSSTFHLERTFTYPSDTKLVRLLVKNLDFAGATMKVWDLGNFTVTRKSNRSFIAQKGDDLDGHCFRNKFRNGIAIYVGIGTYRPDKAPINVRGNALVELKWENKSDTNLKMQASLRLRPESWLLHWFGKLMYVLVQPELEDSFDELIERGQKLALKLKNNPRSTYEKLKQNDANLAEKWKKFALKTDSWY